MVLSFLLFIDDYHHVLRKREFGLRISYFFFVLSVYISEAAVANDVTLHIKNMDLSLTNSKMTELLASNGLLHMVDLVYLPAE